MQAGTKYNKAGCERRAREHYSITAALLYKRQQQAGKQLLGVGGEGAKMSNVDLEALARATGSKLSICLNTRGALQDPSKRPSSPAACSTQTPSKRSWRPRHGGGSSRQPFP